ncbi:hypothetical protein AAG906_035726 [Vitis piasezkii]
MSFLVVHIPFFSIPSKCHTLSKFDIMRINPFLDDPSNLIPPISYDVYKIKTKSNGSVERYKATLVVKGFTHKYGMDYEETFAPVAKMTTIHALIAVVFIHQWHISQMGVKKVFLNGDLKEEIIWYLLLIPLTTLKKFANSKRLCIVSKKPLKLGLRGFL